MSKPIALRFPIIRKSAVDPLVLIRICGLADSGEIEQATKQAEVQLASGAYTPSLLAIWLAGRFAADGPGALPFLLQRAAEQLARDDEHGALEDWAAAWAWLTDNVRTRVRFHAKFHDKLWERWIEGLTAATLEELDAAVAGVLQAAGAELPPFAETLQSLNLVVSRTFASLLPERADTSEEALVAPALESEPVEADIAARDSLSSTPPPSSEPAPALAASAVVLEPGGLAVSGPFRLLLTKLAAFQELVTSEGWHFAAIVARDIEQELAQFDAVKYFPDVFTRYLSTLRAVGGELELHMQQSGSLQDQALERLYRANPERFLEHASRQVETDA